MSEKDVIKDIEKCVEKSALHTKNLVISEYKEIIEFIRRPWKLIWMNFLIGAIRGIGFAVGVAVLGAIVVAIIMVLLKKMVTLPIIGSYIADIVMIVKEQIANH